jgi:hypothetical protein
MGKPSLRLAPNVHLAAGGTCHFRGNVGKASVAFGVGIDPSGDLSPRSRTARCDHTHVTSLHKLEGQHLL